MAENSFKPMTLSKNLNQQMDHNFAVFEQEIKKSSLWLVFSSTDNNAGKPIYLFDSKSKTLSFLPEDILKLLQQNPFVYVSFGDASEKILFDSSTKLFWNGMYSERVVSEAEVKQLGNNKIGGLRWKLAGKNVIAKFARNKSNPLFDGGKSLKTCKGGSSNLIWGYTGIVEAEMGFEYGSKKQGSAFFINDSYMTKGLDDVANFLVSHNAKLFLSEKGKVINGVDLSKGSTKEIFLAFSDKSYRLQAVDNKMRILNFAKVALGKSIEILDYQSCRLPKLEQSQLTDPNKGLWELWGQDEASLQKLGVAARNPHNDIKPYAIAIDFGTSSTVVAADTENGSQELLRIGTRDFFQPIEAKHFENPTVLECLDYAAFKKVWGSEAYRPQLNWEWMRASHEAQTNFRDNAGDMAILSSILPRLKQWALRSNEHHKLKLTDRKGLAFEVPEHIERNAVRGQALAVTEDDLFDPMELYAWYLGMAINWRGRGIFLRYYLSFPVKYPRAVKNKMLASFRRGLQRSLPESLIKHYPDVLNQFTVEQLASEPEAYAAAALQYLDIEPTEEGVPYAVFDFGGGTSDFDYGLLRWATEQEEQQGYGTVFEHIGSSGDNFLGGENLLELLVYENFKHNLGELRSKHIQFIKPMNALNFPGSEAFISNSQAAQVNTVMLAAKLRGFLESENADLESQIRLDLIDNRNEKVTCELSLDSEALDSLLYENIKAGMLAFLMGLAKAKTQFDKVAADAVIHILLAGNGSRSRHIQQLCDPASDDWQALCQQAFGNDVPNLDIHPPLPMDDSKPFAPTAKTGVALGLLHVAPGTGVLLQNHTIEENDGEAPFMWFVGHCLRRNQFTPILQPNCVYGQWQELGVIDRGMFQLAISKSSRALAGLKKGDAAINILPQHLAAAAEGSKLFVRAVSPNTIELADAVDKDSIHEAVIKKVELA